MLVIFLVALSVRLIHLWQISRDPLFSVLVGDARSYDVWARQVAAGDWFGSEVFYQAPLYPYLLGGFYALFGHNLIAVLIAQAVGGAASCVLLALAGTRLFTRRIGIAAGLLLAVYPPAVFFDGIIQKTSLDALLVCLMLWLIARLVTAERPRSDAFVLGLAAGALSLTRENALVLAAVLLAWLVWRTMRSGAAPSSAGQPRAAGVHTVLLFFAGVAVLLAPAAIRNSMVGGGFTLTTSQLGPNLYIGNNASADGTYQPLRAGRGTAEYERADAIQLAEQATGRPLTPGEVSTYWTRRALEFVSTAPRAWSRLMLRKLLLLANRVEVADTESQERTARWSLVLRVGQRVLNFGVLLPLAILGLLVAGWQRWERLIVPVLAAVYAASVLAFYVFARYRFPLVPFLVLWAAAGLMWLWDRARTSRQPSLSRRPNSADGAYEGGLAGKPALVLVATVAVAVVANWPLVSHASMEAVSENSLGAALQADGRPAEAAECFRRAISLDAGNSLAYVNLGVALQAAGKPHEAVEAFAKAAAMHPDMGDMHFSYGRALMDEGRNAQAIEELRLAVAAMQDSAEARTALGLALASDNRLDEAIVQFREVARRTPAHETAAWNLGAALAASGQFREAIPYLEEALRRDPSSLEIRRDLAAAYNQRGAFYASNGGFSEAVAEFQRALTLDPDLDEAKRNLAAATKLMSH